ncbi:MAG: diguanylate cyclase [Oligoflexales bacterium]
MGIFVCIPKLEVKEIETILHNGGYSDLTWCYDAEKISKVLNLGGKSSPKAPATDLVLLDISSDRESIKQCKMIKESPLYNEVPVIILSENNSQETFQMAFAYGASDFIMKPIRNFELLTRVRSALKMKHEIDRRKSRERELLEVTRQLSDLNTVLNRLSLIDSLTGVPNRRCFDQSLDQELRLSVRNAFSLSLILIDIDYFKLYNDSYGHQAGDECLKSIAQCISLCLRRPSDLI